MPHRTPSRARFILTNWGGGVLERTPVGTPVDDGTTAAVQREGTRVALPAQVF